MAGKSYIDKVVDAINDAAAVVNFKDLNNSYKYLGYMGGAALTGAGLGLGYSGLKGLVDRAYRHKLRQGILESDDVEGTYSGRVTPVQNSFVLDSATADKKKKKKTKKAASAIKTADSAINGWKLNSAEITDNIRKYFDKGRSVAVSKENKLRDIIAANMASHPQIAHTLAFASLPALMMAGIWGGSAAGKALGKSAPAERESRLREERARAEKEYNAAAKELRNVMKKDSSLHKQAAGAQSVARALGRLYGKLYGKVPDGVKNLHWKSLLAGGGLTYAGQRFLHGSPGKIKITVPNPNEVTGITALDKVLPWILGLGALGALAPGYKFVQSMRNGYKDQKDSVSDISRATQAWNAIHNENEEDYATLRAALENEPSLSKLKS